MENILNVSRDGKCGPDVIKRFGGIVTIEVLRGDKDNPKVIDRREIHNTVVNSGKKQLLRIAVNSTAAANLFDQFRIGTSGAAVVSNQTNVLSPVTGTLNTADSKSLLSGTRTLQLVISYPSGGASKSATNIQEVVVLNQNTSPGGSCLMRATFTSVNKTTADKLKITYSLRIT
jgi:hypothetical protein